MSKITAIAAREFMAVDREGSWSVEIKHSPHVALLLQRPIIAWYHNSASVHWKGIHDRTTCHMGSLEQFREALAHFEEGTHHGVKRTGQCNEPNVAEVTLLVSTDMLPQARTSLRSLEMQIEELIETRSGSVTINWEEAERRVA